jgi:hypothetical protein
MTTTVCVHHFKLTPPSQSANGISVGVCKLCHESQEFSNLDQNEGRPSWQNTRKNKGVKVRY